ncbi:MAG: restriction endonuclease subunit S [Nitrospira sp.]
MSSKKKNTDTKEEGKPALVPKLRFPEFRGTEGWEGTTLSKIANPVSERAIQGEEDNVLSLSGEHGIVLQSQFFGKKVAGDNAERYLRIARNDFVYNDRTTKASTFGTIKRLSKHPGGIVSPIYKCFRFQDDENPVFWEWYFESGIHNKALAGLVNEGARAGRFNISITQFLSTGVWRPGEAEQQKIAECLSSVNELIVAQARKVDALKTHKKWLMQQLFPREGETQPRLRFPEFKNAGEWEEKTLDQLVDVQSGGTPSKANPEFWNGSIPWVSAKDMKQLFLVDTEDLISTAALDDGAKLVPSGTLLILIRGMTLLKDVPICVLRREMTFNQDVKALRPKDDVDAFFLGWLLTANKQRLREMVGIAGHGTGKIDTDELKAFLLAIPPPAEQERIADCLTSLDDLIAAQTQKLDALKTYKKGLMQQLFPSPEEVVAG